MSSTQSFARLDESSDSDFYETPRFVNHIDDAARDAVTDLYRERFRAGARVLDVMSSWVSHLPHDVPYASVTGLGLNREELDANPRLTARVVHDLNANPVIPFADVAFDAVAICVSVQYLTQPVAVLRELARVTTAGSPIAITFSNRRFPTKSVAVWNALDDAGHALLVERYLHDAGWVWVDASRRATRPPGDPLYAVTALRA